MKAFFTLQLRSMVRVVICTPIFSALLTSCGGSEEGPRWMTAVATIAEGRTPTTFSSMSGAGSQVKLLDISPKAIECGAVQNNWEWNIVFPGIPPDMVLHVLVAQADATRLLETGRFVYRDTYESRGLPYTVIPCERFLLTLP